MKEELFVFIVKLKNMRDYYIEAMQEILESEGISVTLEQAERIAQDYEDIRTTIREHESKAPELYSPSSNEEAEAWKAKCQRLSNKIEVYENYIKSRTGAGYVTEQDGLLILEE